MRRLATPRAATLCAVGLTAIGPHASLATSRRYENTGAHHSFEPGPLTKAIRKVFVLFTPSTWRELMAVRMEKNLKVVEELEKENAWLRRHGSPLRVMGLPEHATLMEVKTRYRDLIFETHPDTAPHTSTSVTEADGTAASSSSSGTSSTTSIARRPTPQVESDYEILQGAYKMLLNPNSLYHRNNAAPALLEDLYELAQYRGTSKTSQVAMFGWATWVLGGIVGAIIVFVGMRQGWELMFRLFDPEFYRFIQQREAEDAALVAQGIAVDPDPKQYAPESVKRLMFPGRFVHGSEEKIE